MGFSFCRLAMGWSMGLGLGLGMGPGMGMGLGLGLGLYWHWDWYWSWSVWICLLAICKFMHLPINYLQCQPFTAFWLRRICLFPVALICSIACQSVSQWLSLQSKYLPSLFFMHIARLFLHTRTHTHTHAGGAYVSRAFNWVLPLQLTSTTSASSLRPLGPVRLTCWPGHSDRQRPEVQEARSRPREDRSCAQASCQPILPFAL